MWGGAAGESGVDQLVEIIKVLGTPTREEIYSMNPNYTEFKFPKITAHPWSKVFSKRMPPDAVDLVRPPPVLHVQCGLTVCHCNCSPGILQLLLHVLCSAISKEGSVLVQVAAFGNSVDSFCCLERCS